MKMGQRSKQGARVQYVMKGISDDDIKAEVRCERCNGVAPAAFVISECAVVGYPPDFRACGECMIDFMLTAKMQRASQGTRWCHRLNLRTYPGGWRNSRWATASTSFAGKTMW
jgi:hypothetical protein